MLPRFEYYAPADILEACRLKAAGAKPVAGGTDVYVNMHGGKEKAAEVLDLKGLKERMYLVCVCVCVCVCVRACICMWG